MRRSPRGHARKKQYVEQIILVTDEGENTAPLFVDALKKYREDVKADPNVCFVRTPGGVTELEEQCRRAGIMVDAFQFTGDYYALPNLVPLLSRPSKLDLLMEILEYPLPAASRRERSLRIDRGPCPTAGAYKHQSDKLVPERELLHELRELARAPVV